MVKESEQYNFADDNAIWSADFAVEKLLKIVERESQSATDWFKENNMVVNSEKVRGKGGSGWGALYVTRHGWLAKKMLGFRWSTFLAKYFYQYFQILSVFIDKILSIFQNLLTL